MSTLTLRLTDNEQKQLEALKAFTDNKTSSGALREVISNYMHYVSESEHYKQQVLELNKQLGKTKSAVKNYIEAKDTLADMAYGEEWKAELDRRTDRIKQGKSTGYSLEEFKTKAKRELRGG